jgi:hypothetical protein
MKLYHVASSCLSLLLFVVLPEAQGEVREAQEAAAAAVRLRPSLRTSKDTKFVSCFSKGLPTGSRIVRSPILTAPDGLHRAYVEVEATAFRPKDEPPDSEFSCENTSRLFIAGPEDSQFKLVFSQSPPDLADGNSLKLVDWSPDGAYVLMERTIWKYESEGNYTDLVLFSLSSGGVTVPDLPKILEGRYGKDCGSENSVIGFTPEGNVVILVAPVEDAYYNEGATSCVKRKTRLALDTKSALQQIVKVLPGDFKGQHYGNFLNGNHQNNN